MTNTRLKNIKKQETKERILTVLKHTTSMIKNNTTQDNNERQQKQAVYMSNLKQSRFSMRIKQEKGERIVASLPQQPPQYIHQ